MQVQKTPILGQEMGCNITVFFINLCFTKCGKLSFFGIFCHFCCFFQKALQNRYFSTFFKANTYKKIHFRGLLSGPSRGLLSGPSWVRFKNANLDQIVTL